MKTTVTESLRVWRRRAMAAALALLLAGGVVALTASAASANMAPQTFYVKPLMYEISQRPPSLQTQGPDDLITLQLRDMLHFTVCAT